MATDVAGRGIDIQDVSMVVNYDMAKNIEGKCRGSSFSLVKGSLLVSFHLKLGCCTEAAAAATSQPRVWDCLSQGKALLLFIPCRCIVPAPGTAFCFQKKMEPGPSVLV